MIGNDEFEGDSDFDSFAENLDDFVPPAAEAQEEVSLDFEGIDDEDDEDDFNGFQIDLDSVADNSGDSDDEEDITSLLASS